MVVKRVGALNCQKLYYSIYTVQVLSLTKLEDLFLRLLKFCKHPCVRLYSILPPEQFDSLGLQIQHLTLGWEDSLQLEELHALAHLCPNLLELKGVSAGILDDQYRGDRHLQDEAMCTFLKSFRSLKRLTSNLKLSCLNSFLAFSGDSLTTLTCSTLVLGTKDLLVMRRYHERIIVFFNGVSLTHVLPRYCVNLEKLEGRFSVDNTVDRTTGDYHADHTPEYQVRDIFMS